MRIAWYPQCPVHQGSVVRKPTSTAKPEFLARQPPFAAVVDELLGFIGADPLVIEINVDVKANNLGPEVFEVVLTINATARAQLHRS
jgi:hypothetical protein